jgi:hypothetical protein
MGRFRDKPVDCCKRLTEAPVAALCGKQIKSELAILLIGIRTKRVFARHWSPSLVTFPFGGFLEGGQGSARLFALRLQFGRYPQNMLPRTCFGAGAGS